MSLVNNSVISQRLKIVRATYDVAHRSAIVTGAGSGIGHAIALESWRQVIEVNLNAVFYDLKEQLPSMAENGGGSIINMASILGSVGFPTSGAYVTAKHGLGGLTKNAALEYGAKKVRTNAVGPGFIHTPETTRGDSRADASSARSRPHCFARVSSVDTSRVSSVTRKTSGVVVAVILRARNRREISGAAAPVIHLGMSTRVLNTAKYRAQVSIPTSHSRTPVPTASTSSGSAADAEEIAAAREFGRDRP